MLILVLPCLIFLLGKKVILSEIQVFIQIAMRNAHWYRSCIKLGVIAFWRSARSDSRQDSAGMDFERGMLPA